MNSRRQRQRTREIARANWIKYGDIDKAMAATEADLSQEYGFVVELTVITLLVQLAYTLFRFWKDTHVSIPPESPMSGEPSID